MPSFSLPHQHGEAHMQTMYRELSHPEHFSAAAECFKQLSDVTRIRIFWLLCHQEECVVNLAAWLGMSSPAISHHLRSLHECGLLTSRRDGKEVYYRAADSEESQLLHQAVERMMEITCPEKTVDFQASQEELMYRVHAYLMDHLSERIPIAELSKRFLMNPTSLKQAFKQVYGTSLAAHMKAHRMKRAAELLLEGKETVAQIALSVGYESQSRFTTAFKDTYGMLPREYRRQTADSAAPQSSCEIENRR